MIDKDRFEEILDELACELPKEFFESLNGGIVILDDAKLHESSIGDDLYIMGEYRYDYIMGRRITIYYGSFERVFGGQSERRLKNELRRTLRHEFRHHLEGLSGERGLEIEDEKRIGEYLYNKQAGRERRIRRKNRENEK